MGLSNHILGGVDFLIVHGGVQTLRTTGLEAECHIHLFIAHI